jgi:hypothetical protein
MRFFLRLPLVLVLVAAAAAAPEEAAPETGPLFTFAVIADPHLAGKTEHEKRLEASVRWINAHRKERRVELVLVLGDIAWGARAQIEKAKAVLDRCAVPYVPLIGDNEVQSGSAARFHAVFAGHYARLARRLGDWRQARVPVVAPDGERRFHLQNFSFEHRGVRFIGLDWCTREKGESADLHDFPGGTLPWLREEVKMATKGVENRIVLLSHLPMHCNVVYEVFRREEQATVDRLLRPHAKFLYANFAGHYHFTWHSDRPEGGYALYVTDAAFRDDNTIRLVSVRRSGNRFAYEHERIRVPPPEPD